MSKFLSLFHSFIADELIICCMGIICEPPCLVWTSPFFLYFVLSSHRGSLCGIVLYLLLSRRSTSLLETSVWQATSSLVLINTLRFSTPILRTFSPFFSYLVVQYNVALLEILHRNNFFRHCLICVDIVQCSHSCSRVSECFCVWKMRRLQF